MPREKLTKLKVLNRRIAGVGAANTMSATVVGSGSFYDPTQATGSLSIPNCVFKAGDVCLLCVALNVSGDGSDVSAATVGGLGLSEVSGFPPIAGDQALSAWARYNITAGSKTVAITSFALNPTACAAVVVAVSGAKTVNAVDGSSGNSSATAAFDTLATSSLLFANEFAVAMVASQNASIALGPTWNGGFVAPSGGVGHVGTNSGGPPSDTVIDIAFMPLLSAAAVNATGTLPNAVSWGAGIVTIKPL